MANTTDNSDKRLRNRRKRTIKKSMFLVPKLVLVFAIFFLIITMFIRAGSAVSTYTALNGKIEEYIVSDGFIFRDQTLVESPADGYFECVAEEGERVIEGATLASVYQNAVNAAAIEEIADIQKKISEIENARVSADVFSGSASRIEVSIAEQAREMARKRSGGNFSDIASEKDIIDGYIAAKQSSTSGGKTDEERLGELQARLHALESSGEYSGQYIYSPTPGVFSSHIDGYEEALSTSMLDNATPGYLSGLKPSDVSVNDTVTAGENVCKVINNYEWYFSGIISEKEAVNFEEGQTIKMKFYDLSDSVIYGTVDKISRPEGGNVAVTVHSSSYVDSIYTTSKVSAELFVESAEGFKVPSESLRVIDGQQGVYVVRLGVARFVPVNLIYNNKEWAIIEPVLNSDYDETLEIYDEVIINTKGITDGEVVRQ